jgi:hypothetical protein
LHKEKRFQQLAQYKSQPWPSYNTLSSATLIAQKPLLNPIYSPTVASACETVSFLVILLITMPRNKVRQHIPKFSHERGHSWPTTTFHSQTYYLRRKVSKSNQVGVNISNILTPLHITNLTSIILLHNTTQIENISFKLLRFRSLQWQPSLMVGISK